MTRVKTFQIRIDESCKCKLDSCRQGLSYNQFISHVLLDTQGQLELYKICSRLISKINEGSRPFRWEYDRLKEYMDQLESKQKIG